VELLRSTSITPTRDPDYDDGKEAGLDIAADLIEDLIDPEGGER
jgi:hypothetical protein